MKPAAEERLLEKNTLKYKQDRGWANINMALRFLPAGFNFIIIKFDRQLHFGIRTFRNNETDADQKKKKSFFLTATYKHLAQLSRVWSIFPLFSSSFPPQLLHF